MNEDQYINKINQSITDLQNIINHWQDTPPMVKNDDHIDGYRESFIKNEIDQHIEYGDKIVGIMCSLAAESIAKLNSLKEESEIIRKMPELYKEECMEAHDLIISYFEDTERELKEVENIKNSHSNVVRGFKNLQKKRQLL